MDERMRNDGRNPYGSRGGYVVSSRGGRGRGRGRRGDRGMGDYGMYDMRGDYNDMARGGYRGGRGRGGDRGEDDYDMARREDMRYMDERRRDYGYGQMRDGHHYPQQHGGQTYYPIEAMGTFNGYYGMPEQDYGRGRDYGYDMRGRRDYGDYGYDDYGDYGETLSEKELEHWCHKLKSQLDDREKQMFSKEAITQRAKQMGGKMEGFGEKELEVATLMVYTDYKKSIGQNLDLAIKLAMDWLNDDDVAVKGAEKLAVYYDCIVEGE